MSSDAEKQAMLAEAAAIGLKINPRKMTFNEICRQLGPVQAATPKKSRKKAPRQNDQPPS